MRLSSSSKCNEGSCLPITIFTIVGMILLHHSILLFTQLKSKPMLLLEPVHGWTITNNALITHSIIRPGTKSSFSLLLPSSSMTRQSQMYSLTNQNANDINDTLDSIFAVSFPHSMQRNVASVVLGCTIFLSTITTGILFPTTTYGYSNGKNEYISEPVQTAIQAVKDAKSSDELVKAYENIADIIIEGKGVGGSINFRGVQLDRGYVSDEDTSIYNPGLTLLTETEKTRLVDSVVESKQKQYMLASSVSNNADVSQYWNNDLEAGFSFLRDRLDPLHMYELHGYLSILPIYGAIMYLIALGIQQVARDIFPIAYIICAAAVFVPIIALVVIGPQ